jgi:hypothetical protein
MVLGWVGHLVRFIYERCTLVLGQSRGFLPKIAKFCSNAKKSRYFPSWAEEVFNEADLVPAAELHLQKGVYKTEGNFGEAYNFQFGTMSSCKWNRCVLCPTAVP